MTSGTGCPGGGVECDYSETHELALVERVLRAIDQYNQDKQAAPCPGCLRDAILAVAALLHLRAAPIGSAGLHPALSGALEAEFGEAARESLRAVTFSVAGSGVGFKQ